MSKNKPYIIGIAGGSGSGKTFFLKCFLEHFSADEVCLVSQDDYYIPVAHNMTPEENKLYNFDLPRTIDMQQFHNDITRLINNETITKLEYTFNNPNAIPKTLEIKPAPILIVEGLFILHFQDISNQLNLKIFLDTDEEVALQRRLKRDLNERGYSHDDVLYKWHNHVVPAYKEYLLPYREGCHKIVVNNSNVAEDIIRTTDEISDEVRTKLFGE
ncbi:uridine kinase family protein [Mucilaginibacter terrae]|uniref:Uridine kinase n=1 Tax=Mucilaginibacter terrae TaxID=1955052 RepID=A0ABU3GRX1_9SPHI|nr:uridine kinase [Mucilaginibacter terrae]MDT3402519.1 uridine kinase [Mucilaginibacter terrae]